MSSWGATPGGEGSRSAAEGSTPAPAAATVNKDANLFRDFETAYASLVSTLTAEDTLHDKSQETLAQEEEEKIQRFMDLARGLENFFLERRVLLHTHKPDSILKDDTMELRKELQAKDELLRRHFDKLSQWQALLSDMQAGGGQPQQQQPQQQPGGTGAPRPPPPGAPGPGAPMQPGIGAPQGGFFPGNSYRIPGPGGRAIGGQDPLSYLEKSTSNLGR